MTIRAGITWFPVVWFGLLLLAGVAEGGWQYRKSSDPFTDGDVHIAMVSSTADDRSLIVRCDDKKRVEVFADFRTYLGDKVREVKFRFDKGPVREEYWGSATKGTSVFAREPLLFARDAARHNTVAIQVIDFRGVRHTAQFTLEGGADAVAKVLIPCGRELKAPHDIPELASVPDNVKLDVERWGPKNTRTKKETLKRLGYYDGDVDEVKEPKLYLAALAFQQAHSENCRQGRAPQRAQMFCPTSHLSNVSTSVGSLIYSYAPDDLRPEMGNLKISD